MSVRKGVTHWSQSRLDFEPEKLHALGVRHIYAFPGYSAGDWFCDESTFISRLETLRRRREETENSFPDMQVHCFGITASHPEGQAQVPPIFQSQLDIDGNPREGFVCLRDLKYREVLLERYRNVARAGFRRVLFDDDLKDALCFCPLHIDRLSNFIGIEFSLEDVAAAFRDPDASGASAEIRQRYIALCRETVLSLAMELEKAIHEISPTTRIGTCLQARRFQDLTGIVCTDIIDTFDTPEAPSFARLPGEHYSALPLDMAAGVGYHLYYDELLPARYERCWEATTVGSAPYQPKSSSQMLQEEQIAEALGVTPVLWAWPEDFERLHIWRGLLAGSPRDAEAASRSAGRDYLGLPVYLRTGLAHELSLEQHMTDGVIKGYQTVSLMGLPARLTSEVSSNDDTICLFGPQPQTVALEANSWLEEGRTLVADLPAVRGIFGRFEGVIDLSLKEPDARPHLEKNPQAHSYDTAVAGLPIGSVAVVGGENVKPLSVFCDASGNELGAGVSSVSVGNGELIILPFDLREATFRLGRFHRDILLSQLPMFRSTSIPYVDGDAFLQMIVFQENREMNAAIINYSDYPVSARLRTLGTDQSIQVDLGPLSVTRRTIKGIAS